MIYREHVGIPYFEFETLAAQRGVRHAVFTRFGGVSPRPLASLNLSVSVPDEKARVVANRRRAYGVLGRDSDTVAHAHLVHGRAVARVTAANHGSWAAEVDGLITNEPGCGLTMNYADCTPIFVYDPVHHALGLGHAGWQGAVADLPGALVAAMGAAYGSRPSELIAAIGPTIGPCCYEVGEPLIGRVFAAFEDAPALFTDAPEGVAVVDGGRPYFNLPESNRRNLIRAGVEQIELSGFCTACRTDLFFSHRAERGKTGRFGVMIVLD